jgi:hypothetical protein
MRWDGHVAFMGERRGVYKVLVRNLRERNHLGDPVVDGRIILKSIFRKWDNEELNDLYCSPNIFRVIK